MPNFIDLTGQRFGRWTIIGRAPTRHTKSGSRIPMWNCVCDCGVKREVRAQHLKSGATKSCGCLKSEINSEQIKKVTEDKVKRTGGHSREPLYNVWNAIRQRCHNKNHKAYAGYGARGITMCDEWLNDYMAFKSWMVQNGYKKGLTVDRLDNSGPYAPWNCRLATQKQQQNNKTINIVLTMKGETHTLKEWAESLDVNYLKAWKLYRKRGLIGDELYDAMKSLS